MPGLAIGSELCRKHYLLLANPLTKQKGMIFCLLHLLHDLHDHLASMPVKTQVKNYYSAPFPATYDPVNLNDTISHSFSIYV